jgi:hypothetical protein
MSRQSGSRCPFSHSLPSRTPPADRMGVESAQKLICHTWKLQHTTEHNGSSTVTWIYMLRCSGAPSQPCTSLYRRSQGSQTEFRDPGQEHHQAFIQESCEHSNGCRLRQHLAGLAAQAPEIHAGGQRRADMTPPSTRDHEEHTLVSSRTAHIILV